VEKSNKCNQCYFASYQPGNLRGHLKMYGPYYGGERKERNAITSLFFMSGLDRLPRTRSFKPTFSRFISSWFFGILGVSLALTPWAETLNDLESFSSSGLSFSPSISFSRLCPGLPSSVWTISVWTCAKCASLCPLNNCVKLFLSFSQFSFHFHFPPLLWRSWKVICILWSPRISKHHV